jgi:hypothetical protein
MRSPPPGWRRPVTACSARRSVLFAGVLFGANYVLLDIIAAASNGAWSSFFLVGTIAGALRWIRGDGRALVLTVACLVAASQLHGTSLVLGPPIVLAALWWRPPLRGDALVASVLVVLAMYSPWLVYQWQSGGADFWQTSAAWMVGEGPSLIARLTRVVPALGAVPFVGRGATLPLVLLTIIGAVALASGRAVAPGERAAACMVVLLLVLPVGATLFAGQGWADRYAAPIVAPAALAAAAALRLAAGSLPSHARWPRRAIPAAAAIVLLVLVGTALAGGPLRGAGSAISRGQTQLGLDEQTEVIRVLGEHGFGAVDLERRVHGTPWTRWNGGQVYLGRWLIGSESHVGATEHAVVIDCETVRPGFASWQSSIASSPFSSRRIIGYRTELSPATVEFVGPGGVLWRSDQAVPFYGQMTHGGDAQMRVRFDPRLAYPSDFNDLQLRWLRQPPTAMRLSTTLRPGATTESLPSTTTPDCARR